MREETRSLIQESNSDYYRIEGIDDIHKSSIISFYSSLNWIEGLKSLQKLAFCIILGKCILISAISSIVLSIMKLY